ncbi:MAG TPA: PP2C family protein-serine/threonine phosphatase [Anaerolineales bacterium]|nr:PP2C family protein-serine/threonine phosphatase [Anaerolineales bacterium]
MAQETIQSIQRGLEETREHLTEWIEVTPEAKKQVRCCSDDPACVEEHLRVIDGSIEKIREGTFGICEICHEKVDDELLRMDYTSTVCLGHYTEAELHQLESELELSQVVQRGLLPQAAPEIPGLGIAAFSRPAQIVSGDYFDFVNFRDGAHGIVLADVSGHGVSAGMMMSSLQTAFHTLVPLSDSPLDVLERINHLYAHNISFTTFVTVFFGKFDASTRLFTYASAGHNSGYIFRPSTGEEILLHPTGPAIGLMEGFHVRLEQVQLQPGDTMVLYTDGVTEAGDGGTEQWSLDGLAQVVRENHGLPPEQLVQRLLLAVNNFTGGAALIDDATIIVGRLQ